MSGDVPAKPLVMHKTRDHYRAITTFSAYIEGGTRVVEWDVTDKLVVTADAMRMVPGAEDMVRAVLAGEAEPPEGVRVVEVGP